jgi:hypothetical protein
MKNRPGSLQIDYTLQSVEVPPAAPNKFLPDDSLLGYGNSVRTILQNSNSFIFFNKSRVERFTIKLSSAKRNVGFRFSQIKTELVPKEG